MSGALGTGPGGLRARAPYAVLAVVTIAAGLVVHLGGTALAPAARDVVGDALWAAMIAWWIGALAPRARLLRRGAVALAICYAVETSQRYHTPTLDAVRGTTVGHLVLGSGFDPRDFAAYAAGVLAAVLVERGTFRRRGPATAVVPS